MSQNQKYGEIAKQLWLKSAGLSKQVDAGLGAIHGIGFAEYMLLQSLMHAPNQSLRRIDIAESLARTGSGVTRMLAPMEKIGLIEKDTVSRDARVSLVKITPAGEKLFKDASATLSAKAEAGLKSLSSSNADKLLNLLAAI